MTDKTDALVAKLNRVVASMLKDDEAVVWWIGDVREVAEALAAPAEGDGAVYTEAERRMVLVDALRASKGWMTDYAEAFVDDFQHGDTRPAATAQVPINWKLVPVVATPEMDAAGKKALSDNGVDSVEDSDALVCFNAMLAAAPAAPKGVDEEALTRAEDYFYDKFPAKGPNELRELLRGCLIAAIATGERS